MQKIKDRWLNIVDKVERFFENEIISDDFELRDDLNELKVLAESIDIDQDSSADTDPSLILFSQLSNYFDSGFYLRLEGDSWNSQAVFVGGQTFLVADHSVSKSILPEMNFNEIRIGNAGQFLGRLDLNVKDPLNKLTALLCRPQKNIAFVLLTKTAEPWLKIKAEKLKDVIIRYYGNDSCSLTM